MAVTTSKIVSGYEDPARPGEKGPVADFAEMGGTVTPAQSLATTAEQKRLWRERLASAHISAGTTLPAIAEVNSGDIRIITSNVANGLSFVDISDPTTTLTAANAGDVMMALSITTKLWVRLGNLLSRPGDDAQEALEAVQANRDIIVDLVRKVADLDIVSDGPGLVNAPVADAGIAIFAEGSTIGDGLLNGNRPFTEADVEGYSWQTSIGLGGTIQAVIVRIEGTLGPVDFYLVTGDTPNQIHSADKILSGSVWDYYYLGGQANERITIRKRGETTHTRYHGELAGRALNQVGEVAERVVSEHEPDPSVTVDPPVWGKDESARTFFVTIHDLRPTPSLQAVDKIRLTVSGIPLGDHDWTVLTGVRVVAFPLSNTNVLDNISNNVEIGDTVRALLTFHATAGGAVSGANQRFQLPIAFSVVAPEDVPSPGGHTTFVDHPRVFHANAIPTPDPVDSSLWWVNFSPNEDGLAPVTNSLFTFVWNINPGLQINRITMSPRGTAPVDAAPAEFRNRESGTAVVSTTDALVQGTTYLARYAGASIVILTRLQGHGVLVDNPTHPIVASAENRDQILYRGERLYRNEPVHHAARTVTWRDFATSDLRSGLTWGGEHQINPTAAAGTVVYSIPANKFEERRFFSSAGITTWVDYAQPNWLGPKPNEAAADAVATAVGQVAFFDGKVQVVASITATTPDAWRWVPLEPRRFQSAVGNSPAILPEGTYEISIKAWDTAAATISVGRRALVSEIGATDEVFFIRLSRDRSVTMTARYAAATRQLVWSLDNATERVSITAIGEA